MPFITITRHPGVRVDGVGVERLDVEFTPVSDLLLERDAWLLERVERRHAFLADALGIGPVSDGTSADTDAPTHCPRRTRP
jgi:hypothetical protein